jgi:hypothetical protein
VSILIEKKVGVFKKFRRGKNKKTGDLYGFGKVLMTIESCNLLCGCGAELGGREERNRCL